MGLDTSITEHFTHQAGMFQSSVLIRVLGMNLLIWLCFGVWFYWRKKVGKPPKYWWLHLIAWTALLLSVASVVLLYQFRGNFFVLIAMLYWNVLWILPIQGMLGILLSKNRKDWLAWSLVSSLWMVGVYSLLLEPQQLHLIKRTVHIPKLPKRYQGLRIMHITDVQTDGIAYREKKVIRLLKQTKPHLILLTGDYLNLISPAKLKEMQRWFAKMKAPLGVIGVNGDHNLDIHHKEMWRGTSIKNISGTSYFLNKNGYRIFFAGVDRLAPYRKRKVPPPPNSHPKADLNIMLAHSPDSWKTARRKGYDLLLSGHTHGGQIVLPLLGPLVTLTHLGPKYARGLFYKQPTWLHVSSGMGYEGNKTPRIRFLCPPEIVLLTLSK